MKGIGSVLTSKGEVSVSAKEQTLSLNNTAFKDGTFGTSLSKHTYPLGSRFLGLGF